MYKLSLQEIQETNGGNHESLSKGHIYRNLKSNETDTASAEQQNQLFWKRSAYRFLTVLAVDTVLIFGGYKLASKCKNEGESTLDFFTRSRCTRAITMSTLIAAEVCTIIGFAAFVAGFVKRNDKKY